MGKPLSNAPWSRRRNRPTNASQQTAKQINYEVFKGHDQGFPTASGFEARKSGTFVLAIENGTESGFLVANALQEKTSLLNQAKVLGFELTL